MKSSRFQVYKSIIRCMYFTSCSPLEVKFPSITHCLSPFTPTTSTLFDYHHPVIYMSLSTFNIVTSSSQHAPPSLLPFSPKHLSSLQHINILHFTHQKHISYCLLCYIALLHYFLFSPIRMKGP